MALITFKNTHFMRSTHSGPEVEPLSENADSLVFLHHLDERLRRRNDKLRGKLMAWAELLETAGWCVSLELPGNQDLWMSTLAKQSFPKVTAWPELLEILAREAPAGFRRIGESVAIWSGRTVAATDALPAPTLTRREREVLTWLREGKTNYEMAVILGCAPRTLEKHLANLYRKLGVTRRAEVLLADQEHPAR